MLVLGALHSPADGVVVETAEARPVLVLLGEHRSHHPDGRLSVGEHLHHAAAALGRAVGALLHVVGAKSHVVLVGEVEVGQSVDLGLFEHLSRLGAEPLGLLDGHLGARVRARRLQGHARH